MNVSYILEKNSLLLSYDMNMWEYMLKVTLKYIHVYCMQQSWILKLLSIQIHIL